MALNDIELNGIQNGLTWIRITRLDLTWIDLACEELHWREVKSIALHWIELKWIRFDLNEIDLHVNWTCIELYSIGIGLNSLELKLNFITLACLDLVRMVFNGI